MRKRAQDWPSLCFFMWLLLLRIIIKKYVIKNHNIECKSRMIFFIRSKNSLNSN